MTIHRVNSLLALLTVTFLSAASSGTHTMPSEVFSRLQALGRTLSPEIIMETQKIYAPYQRKEPYAGVKVERDRHYGSAPRQRLDVLFPETGPPRPVLLFVHGGGFVGAINRDPAVRSMTTLRFGQ